MLNRLQEWAQKESGLVAIWRNVNAPRPARPFISLYITGLNAAGREETGPYLPGDNQQLYFGYYVSNVSVQCHEDANELDPRAAVNRMIGLHGRIRHADLTPLSLLTAPTIINIPQVLGTEWEQQATMDLTLGFKLETREDVSYIERVMGTGDVIAPGGQIIYSMDYDTGA